MKSFHVLFGIDMETDVGSFTPFYEGARNGTPLLLDLFAKKGIKGTFFLQEIAHVETPTSQKQLQIVETK